MSGSIECCVTPRSLRTFIACVCYGAVLLWILHGSYMDAQDEQEGHRRPLAHYRRLLAVSTAVNDTTPVLPPSSNTSDVKVCEVWAHLISGWHHCTPLTFFLSLSLSFLLTPHPLSSLYSLPPPPCSVQTYTNSQAMRASATLSRQCRVVKATMV